MKGEGTALLTLPIAVAYYIQSTPRMSWVEVPWLAQATLASGQ
jgi:hypothetical protein